MWQVFTIFQVDLVFSGRAHTMHNDGNFCCGLADSEKQAKKSTI